MAGVYHRLPPARTGPRVGAMLRALLVAAAAFGLALPAVGQEGARGKPQRVASLNQCADQLVLMLADPANVASVTWLSLDPGASAVAEQAAQVPAVNHGFAEEVLPLEPDLVVAGAYTTPFTIQTLRRVGFNVEVLGVPSNLDEIREQIRLVGELLWESGRARAAISELDAAIAAAAPQPGAKAPKAAILQPGGFTAGPGSFEHDLLTAAGFANVAADAGIEGYGFLSLEVLLLARPALIVVPADDPARPSIAEAMLRHPAMRASGRRALVVHLPAALWNCAGPANAGAVARLAAARQGE